MPEPSSPFLRWAGGKRRLLPVLLAAAPAQFGRYYEPFLGGGAVFLALAPGGARSTLGDVNPQLMAVYTTLRDEPDRLVATLRQWALRTDEQEYLRVRALDWRTLTTLEQAARFVFLNRLCFNGLWRENSRGQFNVPFGKLANPVVCDETKLRAAAAALAGARLTTGSFAATTGSARSGDFVYFDPPYLPLSATSSFSRYASGDFRLPDHQALARCIARLTARGVKVMLSNSDTPLTRQLFGEVLDLHTVSVHRSIAAAGGARGSVTEVLGTNYPAEAMQDADAVASLTTRGPATAGNGQG